MGDSLARQAQFAATQAGRPVDVARAVHVTSSRVSHWRTGKSPELDALNYVSLLAKDSRTSPNVLIESLRVEARRAAMEDRDSMTLIKSWHKLRDVRLLEAQNAAVIAGRHGDREEEIQAETILASLLTEKNAIDRELERRQLDPRDYSASGNRIIR